MTKQIILALSLAACVEPPSERSYGAEEWVGAPRGETRTATVETAAGLQHLTFDVVDGVAVFDGDIELGDIEEIEARENVSHSAGRSSTFYRWPNGVVPYVLDASLGPTQRAEFRAAADHWNSRTLYQVVEAQSSTQYPNYIRVIDATSCGSKVGRQQTGAQLLKFADSCSVGNGIHEIGHAIGLFHEHTRADRDTFVIHYPENVITDEDGNFTTWDDAGEDGRDLFNFGFNSIMMYGSYSWAKDVGNDGSRANDKPTLVRRSDKSTFEVQRDGLSAGDIAGATRVLTWAPGSKLYKVTNYKSGRCLDLATDSRDSNVELVQRTCDGSASQLWYHHTHAFSGKRLLINYYSGHCADVPNVSTAEGARLQVYTCHGRKPQETSWFSSVNTANTWQVSFTHSTKCMDTLAGSTASGAAVVQSTCSGLSTSQRWTFTEQ